MLIEFSVIKNKSKLFLFYKIFNFLSFFILFFIIQKENSHQFLRYIHNK